MEQPQLQQMPAHTQWQGWLKPSPHWVEDADAPACTHCSTKFTVLRRRHHCRRCGVVVCQECSKSNLPLFRYGVNKKQRICEPCSEDVKLENLCVTEHVPMLKTGYQFNVSTNTPKEDPSTVSGQPIWLHGALESNSLKLCWRDINAMAGDVEEDDSLPRLNSPDDKLDVQVDVSDLLSIQSLGAAFTGFSLVYRRLNPATHAQQLITATFSCSETLDCHRWMKALADVIRMINKDKEQVRRFDPRLTIQGGKLIPRMLNGEEKDPWLNFVPGQHPPPNSERSKSPGPVRSTAVPKARLKSSRSMQNLDSLASPPPNVAIAVSSSGQYPKAKTPTAASSHAQRSATVAVSNLASSPSQLLAQKRGPSATVAVVSHGEGSSSPDGDLDDGDTLLGEGESEEGKALIVGAATTMRTGKIGEASPRLGPAAATTKGASKPVVAAVVSYSAGELDEDVGETHDEPNEKDLDSLQMR